MSVLQIFRGDDFLEEIVLSRAVMGLGRHPQNDIVLDDRSLSRFHARVERRGDRFVVVDCGAQNGVHLNGERVVGESDLEPGDRITLGRYVAIFEAAQPVTPPKNELRAAPAGLGRNGEAPTRPPLKASANDLDIDVALDDEPVRPAEPPTRNGKEDLGAKREGVDPTLVLLFNGMEVSRHPVKDGLIIGRSKQSDVVISLLGLSRKHARLTVAGGAVSVEDLGSQNGTWVNNERIEGARTLKHGDLLNFYDYAVLFLEDGDVEVGFPGAGFSPHEPAGAKDLSYEETNRSAPSPSRPPPRPPTVRSPPLVDSQAPRAPAPSQSELVDLGEGSFLGDDFDGDKDDPLGGSLLDDDPLDDDDLGLGTAGDVDAGLAGELEGDLDDDLLADLDVSRPGPGGTTDVVEGVDLGSALRKGIDDIGGFSEADFETGGTNGDVGFDDKTSNSIGERGWATDAELLKALSNAPDTVMVTLEVTLAGKPYTQMPLSQTVTRVGADARCELSLPKTSGLMPWHMTLLHLGGAVVLYRAAKRGTIVLAEKDVDMATLRDGDLLDLGKVRVKVRVK
jgi:pSer/pThr/pTyr-binding forkhead associated (FHA) protein